MNTNVEITLNEALAGMEACFEFKPRIDADPVRFVRQFEAPLDRQTAGLIASSFAYGAVGQIGRTLEKVFSVLGPAPSVFIDEWLERPRRLMEGFYHRFNNEDDLLGLLYAVGIINRRHGSLNGLFLKGYRPSDMEDAMNRFSSQLLSAAEESPFRNTRALAYFFPSPKKGSACKRMCLYLRWMNRKDTVDPGGWSGVDKKDLIVPVDAHISRIGRYLGFTKRKNSGWKMALEITEAFRKIRPEDPLSLDFLICHLGMSGRCPAGKDHGKCRTCLLRGFCQRKDD